MELFHRLHRSLRDRPNSFRPAPPRNARGRATLAFFEAYFSNFVEGTEFLVDEAILWAAVDRGGGLETARVAERELEACNAFPDSDEAEAEGRRLRMPG